MKIAVVGTGYVGLVSGTCFARAGNSVICVDINESIVDRLSKGELTIYEPGLDFLYEENRKAGRLKFTTSLAEAVKDALIICLCLPTPSDEDGSADLKHVLGVAEDLGKIIDDYKIIVDKSTVPVGTAELVRAKIAENATCAFDVVSNPEFLREGYAVQDFLKPDRVVVGTSSERAKKVLENLYKPFLPEGRPVLFMDERSAEMTKYAANSYLATRITFMNEVATLCEELGADVNMVRKGLGSDTRIGHRFLYPGIGYGGSCFPKDVLALVKTAQTNNYDFKILEAVIERNIYQRDRFVKKIVEFFDGNIVNKRIAVWGLAFKPNTDDIREAPSLHIIKELTEKGATVVAYDPEAMENVKSRTRLNINYGCDAYEVLENVDCLCIFTEWQQFRSPDFTKMKSTMKEPVIFDGRNIYDLEQMKEKGITYISIGRKFVNVPKHA